MWLLIKVGVIVVVFSFMVWQMIRTKNWGKFDKTSMIVWGSLLAVIILVVVGVVIMLHSA